jgi:hypothetical protein
MLATASPEDRHHRQIIRIRPETNAVARSAEAITR